MEIIQSSFLYRLYSRIVNAIFDSFKNSGLWRLIAFIVSRFREYIRNSAIVGFFSNLADRFGSQLRNSVLINRFLMIKKSEPYSDSSIFSKIYYWILGVFRALTRSLKLDNLLEGSILSKPWIWCGITAAMAPILPTMAMIALALLGYLSLFINMCLDKKRQLVFFPINKYIWMYALVYILATFASVSRSDSLYVGTVTVCFVLYFMVFTNGVITRKQLRGVVIGIVWVGLLVAAYGFIQYIFSDRFRGGWVDEDMFDYKFRVYSTLNNPNVLAEYFLLVIPFSFACLLTAKSRPGRLFYAVAFLAMVICLVLTYSRGAYLGLIFAAAVFLVMLDRRFIFPGIIMAVIIFFALPTTFIERLLSIGNTDDSSTSYRVFIWLGTLAMLKDYWFCGIGPGQGAFMKVYPVYAYSAISAPHAHNLFLQIMCDTGISGLILIITICYQYFKNMFYSLRINRDRDREGSIFVMAGISAVLGFLVQSMTDYTFYNYRVMLMFWIILAIGLLFTRHGDLEEQSL